MMVEINTDIYVSSSLGGVEMCITPHLIEERAVVYRLSMV
jgi:hypothetical protein